MLFVLFKCFLISVYCVLTNFYFIFIFRLPLKL